MTDRLTDRPADAPAARRNRPAARPVEVVRSERIGPHFQRITFGGPALDSLEITSPTGHIKVFLPGEGETEPALPTRGPDGLVWPEGRSPAVVRTFTPRRFSKERRELEVEFFLHGTGPASSWAERASIGDRAAIAGQGRGYEPDAGADWFLIAGDESALPAIGMIIEALPARATALVVAEVETAADEQTLPAFPALTTTWLHRHDAPAGEQLESALRAVALPPGDGRVWTAGEAASIRRVRRNLITERALPADRVVTRGYWKHGDSNHPDGDYGNDD